MKRALLILLILLVSTITISFSQADWSQDVKKWYGKNEPDHWVMNESGETNYYIDWFVDSLNFVTEDYLRYDEMALKMALQDTNATDSVKISTELWQSYEGVAFFFVSTLYWFPDTVTSATSTPDSADIWYTFIADSNSVETNYWRLKIVTESGNRVLGTGARAYIEVLGKNDDN